MPDDHEQAHRAWRIPDELWERIVPLLPPRTPPPFGGYRPRVNARQAMDAIFCVLRTGCQRQALHATGLCASRAAHRRCQEWTEADVCVAVWEQGLVAYEALHGIDWGLARAGWGDDPSPSRGGTRWASPPRTAARSAPSAASSPTAVGGRLASRSTGPSGMTVR